MDKFNSREDLIAALADDLTPVARVKPQHGALVVAIATLVAALASIAVFGFWSGIVAGEASSHFWITNGLLLMLGIGSTAALVASALPRVGQRSDAPVWSAAMLAVLPVAAIISLVSFEGAESHADALADPTLWYWQCAAFGFAASTLVLAGAVAFLRRGAPVSLERSGWLAGLAAGALGSVAYGITCPLDSVGHVGIWHAVPVALGAIAGRIIVPPLIRW